MLVRAFCFLGGNRNLNRTLLLVCLTFASESMDRRRRIDRLKNPEKGPQVVGRRRMGSGGANRVIHNDKAEKTYAVLEKKLKDP